jgi:nicotinamide mononucleotide adenylyltransferase
MQNILAKGNGKGNGWAMYIGRWQPWHEGHRWLIDQQLNQGKKVCIAIRDMETDEKNPYSAIQVMMNITNELINLVEEGMIRIMIIPDIESINFGRGVGYDIIEHIPPADIHDISATKIREQMKNNEKDIL